MLALCLMLLVAYYAYYDARLGPIVKFCMFAVAQNIILKSALFKNLMWAFTMYFLSISQTVIFSKIHVGGGPET